MSQSRQLDGKRQTREAADRQAPRRKRIGLSIRPLPLGWDDARPNITWQAPQRRFRLVSSTGAAKSRINPLSSVLPTGHEPCPEATLM